VSDDYDQPVAAVTLRASRPDDLRAIVGLLSACDVAEIGYPDTNDEDVTQSWRAPEMNTDSDTWVAADRHGDVVGYAEITRRPAAGRDLELDTDFWVRPDAPAHGPLSEVLLQTILARAAEMADGAAHLAIFAAHSNPAKRALLERHGFAARRRYFRMAVDLPPGYRAPGVPDGIRIGDFAADLHADRVRRLMIAAFSDDFRPRAEPLTAWRARLVDRPDFDAGLWPLALESRADASGAVRERLVGAVIAYDYGDVGWVQGLAVAADRRRRGIGLALLQEAFARFSAREQQRVHLGVDSGNETGALRLYERAGMRQEQRTDLFVRSV
jgi:ribosomal protein S18 acetylase RimI-like enzyme